MKLYKKDLLNGVESDSLNDKLNIHFLKNEQYESGTKIMHENSMSESEMENYSHYSSNAVKLDMRKENFAEKKEVF